MNNKGKKFPVEPLTREEMTAILKVCSRRCPTGIRDRAMMITMWRGQLRISEALSLKPADFDPEACTLRVLFGKRKKCRVVGIDPEAAAELSAWLERRKALGLTGWQPIFCTLKGKPIATSNMREMIPRRARKAGITKRVHTHVFRHTGASEMAAEGVDLKDIQEQLGHSSFSTTTRYIHSLNPVNRTARMRKRQWSTSGQNVDPQAEERKREISELRERLARLEDDIDPRLRITG